MWPFTRKQRPAAPQMERRSLGVGLTTQLIEARASFIAGRSGLAELTSAAQTCVSLWESGLLLADVSGTDLLTRRAMAMSGRALALKGESLWLIRDEALVPCSDWDLRTRYGRPAAYRVSISEAGGGTTETALAAEVLHIRIGVDAATPWAGQSPLRRARLSADLLSAVEGALAEIFEQAPLGSQIVPFPESPDTDMTAIGRSFRGQRGRVLLRESVIVTGAGGPTPQTDWRPSDVSPDLTKIEPGEMLSASRDAVAAAYGVLPALLSAATTGPLVREAQRHLAQWTLQPICELIAEEATEKLGGQVQIDCMVPLQAFDQGSTARSFATLVQALGDAKERGIDVSGALKMLDLVGPASGIGE